MRNRMLTVLAVAALATTACGDDGATSPGQLEAPTRSPVPAPTASPEAAPTGSPEAAALTGCEGDRFTIAYPAGWWTNPGDQAPPCRMFHPTAQQVQGESLHYAVQVLVDPVDHDRAVDSFTEHEVLRRREATVDGRRATVIESRSSGRGLAPEGTLQYVYLVDLDGEVLILQTHSIGDTDYERDRALVDRMAGTLRFDGAGSTASAPSDG